MPAWAIVLIVIAGLAILLGLYVICVYNKLIKLTNNVDESFSTMDVYLKKRYDLLPNLVETVKGYAKHENDTLVGVMKARSACLEAKTPQERISGENALSRTLGRLYKVTENYPDLKANSNFMALQNQLVSLEDEITSARKYYNGCVKLLTNKIKLFPSNLIAKMFGFKPYVLFEVEDVEERKVPQVKF